MVDNEDKNSDADLVEIEADQPSSSVEDIHQAERTMEESSRGGGFVWLLAIMLVVGGGGYAVWPYVAPRVEPVIKDARTILGLDARPTQPSLPGAARIEQVQPTRPSMPTDDTAQAPTPALAPQPEPAYVPEVVAQDLFIETQPGEAIPAASLAEQSTTQSIESSSDGAPMVQSLMERLDLLEAQLLAATSNGRPGEDRAALAATGNLVRTLSELKADLATLKTRVAALENAPRRQIDPSASAQALVLSVTQLGTATESDRPFAAELDALARIGGAQPVIAAAVQRLSMYANTGAPTQPALTAQFKTMAVSVMKAHGKTQRHGWWDEVAGAASSLVTVRQTDPARIDDPVERALAVAELALRDNDLKTAVAAVDTIQGGEGEAARIWRDRAHARVEIREAMGVLHNHALAALAATGGA